MNPASDSDWPSLYLLLCPVLGPERPTFIYYLTPFFFFSPNMLEGRVSDEAYLLVTGGGMSGPVYLYYPCSSILTLSYM